MSQWRRKSALSVITNGISDAAFRSCIQYGIRKINVATANFMAVAEQVRHLYERNGDGVMDYFMLQAVEIEGAYRNAKRHIQIFGCENEA